MNFIFRRGADRDFSWFDPFQANQRQPAIRFLQVSDVGGAPGELVLGKIGLLGKQCCSKAGD